MTKVADLTHRVVGLLESSGRTDAELIIGYTYPALAAAAYEVDRPTPAQTSAVRRVVAKLVADGRAKRYLDRAIVSYGHPAIIDVPREYHERRSKYGETSYEYRNPGGVAVERAPTDEDIEARQRWLADGGLEKFVNATARAAAATGEGQR